MAKAIINWPPTSNYEDQLPDKYHFIEMHRSQIQECVGDDAIIYSAAQTGGCQGYVAKASVVRIGADNNKGPGNYYAVLANFRRFPLRAPPRQRQVRRSERSIEKWALCAFAIRTVSEQRDFERIILLAG